MEQKVDFAGQEVKISKEVEVGSKEHEAMQVERKMHAVELRILVVLSLELTILVFLSFRTEGMLTCAPRLLRTHIL